MKQTFRRLLMGAVIAASIAPSAFAQNAASNKAVFAYNRTGVSVRSFFEDFVLFDQPAAIKTSTQGSLLLGLSMECSLWTFNSVTANGGAPRIRRVPGRL